MTNLSLITCVLTIFILLNYCFCLHTNHVLGLSKTECEPIQISVCYGLGYNVTYMPNIFRHNNQIEAQQAVSFKLFLKEN